MSFVEEIAPYAVKYMELEGILASLTIAQAILESNFGTSELAVRANNLFGMKASPPWTGPIYNKETREFVSGRWIETTASFCKFSSLEECIEYRSSVFLKKERYRPLWGVMDYKAACQIIYECGYATDPNYPQKLINVIEQYELYKYDALNSHSNVANKGVSEWAQEDWERSVENGYFDGTRPRDYLTREEAAIVINRLHRSLFDNDPKA